MPWLAVAWAMQSTARNGAGNASIATAAHAVRSHGVTPSGRASSSKSSASQRRGVSRSVGASPVTGSGCSSRRTPRVRCASATAPRRMQQSGRLASRRSKRANRSSPSTGSVDRSNDRAASYPTVSPSARISFARRRPLVRAMVRVSPQPVLAGGCGMAKPLSPPGRLVPARPAELSIPDMISSLSG
jgi:hypothetical protein